MWREGLRGGQVRNVSDELLIREVLERESPRQ